MVSTGTEVKEVLTAGPNTKIEFAVNPKMLFCDTNSTSSVLNARTGILKPSLRTFENAPKIKCTLFGIYHV